MNLMRTEQEIRDSVERVRERMASSAARAGRNPSEIELLAVTKFHPESAVLAAYASGIRHFGENRVQEALGKYSPEMRLLMPDASLDMIGVLQKNKINKVLNAFDALQSVSSIELLDAVLARPQVDRKAFRIFLELHTGEASKSGFPDIESLFPAVEHFLSRGKDPQNDTFILAGLMTMAPFTGDANLQRRSFRLLAKAREELRTRYSIDSFRELSMGMSSDFETAIEEGSTLIRIGTLLFGNRS